MTAVDFVLVAVLVVAYPLFAFVSWPGFVRDARAGKPGVRVRGFLQIIVSQWSVTSAILLYWWYEDRRWAALGLDDSLGTTGWPWLVVLGVLSLFYVQLWQLRRATPEQRAHTRESLGEVAALMPHDRRELRVFFGVAVTAGFCEELFYRGYVPYIVGVWMPAWSGTAWPLIVATVVFGLGHTYQGAAGFVKATIGAAIAAALVGWSGVLWPAVVLHALVDVHGGTTGWLLLRREPR
jgi:membrane protease YdiL (CAAX protease family)